MTETTISVNGEEYKLDNNPSMRTVKHVQQMQIQLLKDYLDEDDIRSTGSLEEDQIVEKIIDKGGFEAFQDLMWERNMMEPIQTICLAADETFSPTLFDGMGAQDFKKTREAAEEALDGSAEDFFEELHIGISLSKRELQQARELQS